MTRWDLTAISVNGIIGAGIFGLPAAAARTLGPASAIAFGVCAAIVYIFVLSFAEAASHFTETGGPYLYSRTVFGRFVGFEVGWTMWLSRASSFAANTNLFVSYLVYFLPQASSARGRALAIIVVVGVLAIINIRGVKSGARFGTAVALVKLGALVLFGALGLAFMDWRHLSQMPTTETDWGGGLLLIIYAYIGFEATTIVSAEAKNPKRDVGWALIAALGICALIYLAVQTVALGTVPNLAASEKPLADSATTFLGPTAGGLMAALACVSIIGTLSVLMLGTPRLTYALAEGGDLPAVFGKLHRVYRTPFVSILIFSAVVAAFAISGTFVLLVTLSVLSRLLSYVITCLAVPVLRKRFGAAPAFQIPLGPLIPMFGVFLCLWLMSRAAPRDLRDFAVALIVGAALFLCRTQFSGLLIYSRHRKKSGGANGR